MELLKSGAEFGRRNFFFSCKPFFGTESSSEFHLCDIFSFSLKSDTDEILPWQYILTYQEYFQMQDRFRKGNRNFTEFIKTLHESISTA